MHTHILVFRCRENHTEEFQAEQKGMGMLTYLCCLFRSISTCVTITQGVDMLQN